MSDPRLDDMIDMVRRSGTRMPPTVRVTATYPASDGSAPESIEVIWETSFPSSPTIADIIAALAAVTKR